MTNLQPLLKQNGGVAVIIGREKDFDLRFQNHPQVIFWDQDKSSSATKELPANCHFLFCSKFVSHKVSLNAIKQVKQRANCTFFGMERSRAINQRLEELLGLNELVENKMTIEQQEDRFNRKQEQVELAEQPLRAPRYGELKSLVKRFYRSDLKPKHLLTIIKPEVRKLGLSSSDASIKQAITSLRYEEKKRNQPKLEPKPIPQAQTQTRTSSLQHLDEAITYLQLVREEVANRLADCDSIMEMIRKVQIKSNEKS